jgi:hypothetical protein
VLAVLAAGCSGSGDEPVALPTLTAAPSPTATVAPVPPQATANTSQSLDAFVRFYFQQLNVAFSTADPSVIRRYSDPGCTTCNNYARGLEKSDGQRIQGDSFVVTDVAVPPLGAVRTEAEVFGSIPARVLLDSTGKTVRHLPADGRFHFVVTALRRGDAWRVVSIGRGA